MLLVGMPLFAQEPPAPTQPAKEAPADKQPDTDEPEPKETATLDGLNLALKERRYIDSADLAKTIETEQPEFKDLDEVRYLGAVACNQINRDVEAEGLLKRMLEETPDTKRAEAGSHLLAETLYRQRKLDESIELWKRNLEKFTTSKFTERWRFGIAEASFRAWKFVDAKGELVAFTNDYPKSSYMPRIKRMQNDINPPLEVKDFIVQGYAGKFKNDIRFLARSKEIPSLLEESKKLVERRMHIKSGKLHSLAIKFEDNAFRRGVNRAVARTICFNDKPLHIVTFYTEFMVVSAEDYYSRITHELKHVIFRNLMGQGYLNMPRWVREGLAVFSSDQLESRTLQVLSNAVFGGKDPLDELDGLDELSRGPADYIEDGTAFIFLLKLKGRKAIGKFCEAIIEDKLSATQAIEEITGITFEEFKKQLSVFTHERMNTILSEGFDEYDAIMDSYPRAAPAERLEQWINKTALPLLGKWMKDHPDHALTPNVHYLYGKYSVWIKDYETGREHLQLVVDDCQLTSSICDDAFSWICKSYDREGKTDEAIKAWGEYLRDYSWAKTAIENKGNYDVAGPVKEVASETPEPPEEN